MSTTTLADGGRVETNFNYSTGYAEAQKYDAAGAKVGPVYQFATSDGYSVEPLSDGGYVIAVNQNIQYGHQLSGAAFNPSGVKTASLSTPGEFNIETADGGFLIVSRTVIGGHPPGDIIGDSVVKYYANDGTVLGDAKVYAGGQIPTASVGADGNFLVSWNDGGQTQTLTLDPQHPTDLTAPATPAAHGIDDVGPVTGSFTGGTTDDATPTFHVPVTEVGHLGYAVTRNVGYDPAVAFNVAVTAQDVARGYVDITTASALADGSYRFTARAEDATGVVSGYDGFSFTVASAAPATLSISGPAAHNEGNSGTTDFAFTVTRSGDASAAAAADYFLWTDQTDAADFAGAVGGTVRFAAGQTSAVIHVAVAGDTTVEGDETFHIGLSNARGATIATGEAAATILNDDGGATNGGGSTSGGSTGGGDTGAGSGSGAEGHIYTSPGPNSVETGTAGNDTFNASQGYDTLTGGGGNDVFVLGQEPWAPITVTDFAVGGDKLDLSALFRTAGYTGSDPVADHYILLASDGAGGTIVRYDHDGGGPNPEWPNTIVDLQGVSPAGLTWAQLSVSGGTSTGGGSTAGGSTGGTGGGSTGGTAGQVFTSPGPNSVETGTSGNDTFNASQGYDTLTGGGGADVFNLPSEPWAPITITDFASGTDKIDLRALFHAAGYSGSDPVGDHYILVASDGNGGAIIRFDHDGGGPNPEWPNTIIDLQGVAPSQVSSSDWIIS